LGCSRRRAVLFREHGRGALDRGIVSRGAGESYKCDNGATVTRIAPYAAWIKEVSGRHSNSLFESSEAAAAAVASGVLSDLGAPPHAHRMRARRNVLADLMAAE
jgi:hypothetical protein